MTEYARNKAVEALHALDGKDTQTHQILVHLFSTGPLTPLDAWVRYGCYRLGARIKDLRNMGVPIVTRTIKRGGKRYAEYRLEEDENEG